MGILLTQNCPALTECANISDILALYFQDYPLFYFRFMRMYKDGSRINLSNNPKWTETFYRESFYKFAWFDNKDIKIYKYECIIWDDKALKEDNIVGITARRDFSIFHGYTIVLNRIDYCDFFDFTTSDQVNDEINMF